MHLYEYRARYGLAAIEELMQRCDVKASHMRLLVDYSKRASTDLAHRLVNASNKRLTLEALLYPSWEKERLRKEARGLYGAETYLMLAKDRVQRAQATADPKLAKSLATQASRYATMSGRA